MARMTKKNIGIVGGLAKEEYYLRTGRNADDDPDWWEFMMGLERERKTLWREYPQRIIHYLEMGFSMGEVMRREFLEDEKRWKQANKNP